MDNSIKKRWISLYVENQVGVFQKYPACFPQNHIIWTA